jgi:error-prone DNA polymerase
MPLDQQVVCDYNSLGLSLKAHPIQFIRPQLDRLRVLPASALAETPDKTFVRVAGLVLVRQHPSTAKGVVFVTLEDETGAVNLIVRPTIWQRYHVAANRAKTMLASGKLQRAYDVTHVLVTKIEDLSSKLPGIVPGSRDFR